MPLLARISELPIGRTRAAKRRTLSLRVPALSTSGVTPALIHDLSEHGLRIETDAPLEVDEIIRVELPEAGAVDAKIIWTAGQFAGCRFLQPVSLGSVSAALLRSPAKELAPERAWRVELPMIDVVEQPDNLERPIVEPQSSQASRTLFAALLVAAVVSALFVGFLLLMAISGEGAP